MVRHILIISLAVTLSLLASIAVAQEVLKEDAKEGLITLFPTGSTWVERDASQNQTVFCDRSLLLRGTSGSDGYYIHIEPLNCDEVELAKIAISLEVMIRENSVRARYCDGFGNCNPPYQTLEVCVRKIPVGRNNGSITNDYLMAEAVEIHMPKQKWLKPFFLGGPNTGCSSQRE